MRKRRKRPASKEARLIDASNRKVEKQVRLEQRAAGK